MSYRVEYSPAAAVAVDDLLEWQFVTFGKKAEQQTYHILVAFEAQFRERPERYKKLPNHSKHGDLREAVVVYHKFVFALVESEKRIEILLVRHEKSDAKKFRADIQRLG